MIAKLRKLRDQKGFTLVELIVVLVILAILAALLVPAMTGYIDKANQKSAIAECRMAVMAAQTLAAEEYGDGNAAPNLAVTDIKNLADVPGTISAVTVQAGKVTALTYTAVGDTKAVTYTEGGGYEYDKTTPPTT